MLPEAFLNELKYNTDIEQVIGRYVQLRRQEPHRALPLPLGKDPLLHRLPGYTVLLLLRLRGRWGRHHLYEED